MKYMRVSALALAGAMSLTLAACGGGPAESAPSPEASETPAIVSAEPSVEATLPAVTAEPSDAPSESVDVVPAEPTPAGTAAVAPVATPAPTKPVQSQPVETAAPTATPEPAAQVTAAEVYASVSAKAGGSAMSDMSFVLEEYYSISASDLEDYVLYMPDMSTSIEEIFIARVKSGKMDSVKSACEARQKGMAEDAAFYPDTGAYVDGYQLVTNGDWVMFCVCQDPSGAVSAFNDCTK